MSEASDSVTLDLSGIAVRLDGLPSELGQMLQDEWGSFTTVVPGDPPVQLAVEILETADAHADWDPKQMTSRLTDAQASYAVAQGDGQINLQGQGKIRIGVDGTSARFWTMANLLRACLAWWLPTRGSALIHAAGLVISDHAFVLVGGEGTGKSTWAELGGRQGARVVSDDLVLLDGIADRPCLLGTPFRSRYLPPSGRGRWPLAAVLFPRHAEVVSLRRSSGILARAKLAANLPFVTEVATRDQRISTLLDDLVSRHDCYELSFSRQSAGIAELARFAGDRSRSASASDGPVPDA